MSQNEIDSHFVNMLLKSFWHATRMPVKALAELWDFPKSYKVLHKRLAGDEMWTPDDIHRPFQYLEYWTGQPLDAFLSFVRGDPGPTLTLYPMWWSWHVGELVHPTEREAQLYATALDHLQTGPTSVLEYSYDIPWEFLPLNSIQLVVENWARRLTFIAEKQSVGDIAYVTGQLIRRLKRARNSWAGPWPSHELYLPSSALDRAFNQQWPYQGFTAEMMDEMLLELMDVEIPDRGLEMRFFPESPYPLPASSFLFSPYHLEYYERVKVFDGQCYFRSPRLSSVGWSTPTHARPGYEYLTDLYFNAIDSAFISLDERAPAFEPGAVCQRLKTFLRHDPHAAFISVKQDHLSHLMSRMKKNGRRARPSIRAGSGVRFHKHG